MSIDSENVQVRRDQAEGVDVHFELTDEIKEFLKAAFPGKLKKLRIMGQDFVFQALTRRMWEDNIDTWRDSITDPADLNEEAFDKKLIDTAIVFPAMGREFVYGAQEVVFWNNLPAGTQPRLARQIEHHSGFYIADLLQEGDILVEDLTDAVAPEKPDAETLAKVKAQTDMPIKLVRADEWYAIRAMTWSEARNMRKRMAEAPSGEHDVKQLCRCILLGSANFDDKKAGIVPLLLAHLKQVSGLNEEELFESVAEDL